ncbi:DUF4255 domain-containing protein [Emticicia sp. 17c]|uniref:DUF4255 domain-containing protein n=1 Tax=Emticicia sp. 17c TaxID=3127704 RepID=UPI00301C8BA1
MLKAALSFLRDRLNEYILSKGIITDATKAPATLMNLVDAKGDFLFDKLDKPAVIMITLVNLEEETVGKSQLPYFRTPNDNIRIQNPDLKFNQYVLFSTYAKSAANTSLEDTYALSLDMLDNVILYFQFRHSFSHDKYPNLDASIEKMIVEPVSLTLEQMNHLWATLGCKHLPSIVYKVRLLTYLENAESDGGRLVEKFVIEDRLQ